MILGQAMRSLMQYAVADLADLDSEGEVGRNTPFFYCQDIVLIFWWSRVRLEYLTFTVLREI